jgi:hypothetical protein
MIENITDNLSTDIAAKEPMDDAELQAIITQDLTDAVSYVDSDLSPTRAKGTEYYRGDLFGNEVEGNSKVVAMEVRDTVSAMLPSLMRVFFNSENVVSKIGGLLSHFDIFGSLGREFHHILRIEKHAHQAWQHGRDSVPHLHGHHLAVAFDLIAE